MRRTWFYALVVVSMLVPHRGRAQLSKSGLGVSARASVGGTPLGQIAERGDKPAIVGSEYEVRLSRVSSGNREWSLGLVWDSYETNQFAGTPQYASFDYASSSLTAGYGIALRDGVPNVYGVELGIMRFNALANAPDFYTGEQFASDVRGTAAVLAATYGRTVPLGRISLIPTLRLATNYPDFGGGDGYSALHRESDFGFKASFGLRIAVGAPRS